MASQTGSLTSTGSVVLVKPLTDSLTLAAIDGTYGTVSFVFEGSVDGTNYFPLAAIRYDTGAMVTGTVSPSDNAELAYKIPAEGLIRVRLRTTAVGSGTLGVTLESASYTAPPFIAVNQTTSSNPTATTFTGDVTLSGGSDLILSGTTGQTELHLTDNLADALSVKIAGGNDFLVFDTTDSAEVLKAPVSKVRLPDNTKLCLGDSDDITVAWDNTDLDVLQATANSSIKWGVDGAGIDQVWYGDTASTNMTWDQSADALIFTGACDLQFTGSTGQPEIVLTDNLADALSVKISGGNDIFVCKTTDSAETLIVPAALEQGATAADRASIKGIYRSATVSVAVPSITDPDIAKVDVDVSAALTVQPAVGDAVIVIPEEALPSNARLQGAWVSATDTVQVTFGSEGGNVTGASKNMRFLVIDLT